MCVCQCVLSCTVVASSRWQYTLYYTSRRHTSPSYHSKDIVHHTAWIIIPMSRLYGPLIGCGVPTSSASYTLVSTIGWCQSLPWQTPPVWLKYAGTPEHRDRRRAVNCRTKGTRLHWVSPRCPSVGHLHALMRPITTAENNKCTSTVCIKSTLTWLKKLMHAYQD